ncbi:hypothetical protein B14911_26460 [Bacillus sp. NRRL B-14911]|nr:hypothetical protein B14911_26460 [Bacillus sp. NRRL B-14911]
MLMQPAVQDILLIDHHEADKEPTSK